MNYRVKRVTLAAAFIGISALVAPRFLTPAQAAPTQTLFLSGTDKDNTVPWEFQVNKGRQSGTWSTIPVPSNWEMKGFGTYNKGYDPLTQEIGQYRHSFNVPANWSGQDIGLVFEGSMTDTEVKINGQSAGPIHQGSFYRFKYDVSRLIRPGQSNLIEVTVSKDSADTSVNRAERQADYWSFGGIYRPVYLEMRPTQSIERNAINARADGNFTADVYLKGITDADTVRGQIRTLDGKAFGPAFTTRVTPGQEKVTLSAFVANALLWTAETPNRYQIDISLRRGNAELHQMTERFGFRTIEVRPKDGIYLNGRKIVLKGSNRHSIWPTSGRTTSPTINRADALLMKEMNMNAVRMSHYPPDSNFLDACDELGLYVLDELAGWQKRYDTPVGEKLVRETVIRDVNHPSVLFWDNGNEGGWNTELDDDYALYDPQKRTVLHPWSLMNGVQTDHYENYESTKAYLAGQKGGDIYMSTEFLHALFDGGAGAGLNDYWKIMSASPLNAGGFIWAFADEGIVRDDRGGAIDVVGNSYPDGIVGPYREKEASFYTIQEIWSPLQIANRELFEAGFPGAFTGQIPISNSYAFTNTGNIRFDWQLVNFPTPFAKTAENTVVSRGRAASPLIAPGATGVLRLNLPTNWRGADALIVTATDSTGHIVHNWKLPIKRAADIKNRIVATTAANATAGEVTATEDAGNVVLAAGETRVSISKTTGRLTGVTRNGASMGLVNGPTLAAGTAQFVGLTHKQEGAAHVVQANYSGNLSSVTWRLQPSGWLQLDYRYNLTGPQEFMGVNFDLPEKQVTSVKWLGQGPYRVWKNRMRGVSTDVWSKEYNDTATGSDLWKYPEFKGYHSKVNWAQLQTAQGPITVVTPDENMFLRLYTPRLGQNPMKAIAATPAGDISFLDGISAIGSKFDTAVGAGPEGQPNVATGEYGRTIYLYFGE